MRRRVAGAILACAALALLSAAAAADDACTFEQGARVSGVIGLIAVTGGLYSVELKDAGSAVALGPIAGKPERTGKCMVTYLSGFGEVPRNCQNGHKLTASGAVERDSSGAPVIDVEEMTCD